MNWTVTCMDSVLQKSGDSTSVQFSHSVPDLQIKPRTGFIEGKAGRVRGETDRDSREEDI